MTESDRKFLKDIANQLHNGWIHTLSFKIWDLGLERKRERRVTAEFYKALKPKFLVVEAEQWLREPQLNVEYWLPLILDWGGGRTMLGRSVK